MTIIGVDYGSVRTGLAIWDSQVNLALPMNVIEGKGDKQTAADVADVAFFEKADLIVVGHPVSLSGGSGGKQESAISRFIEILDSRTRIPITREDERLSSDVAERLQLEAGGARHAAARDALAAAAILESYVQRVDPANKELAELVSPEQMEQVVKTVEEGGETRIYNPKELDEDGSVEGSDYWIKNAKKSQENEQEATDGDPSAEIDKTDDIDDRPLPDNL